MNPGRQRGSIDRDNVNWSDFREYVSKKYGQQYTSMQFNYAHKYFDFLEQPSMLESLSPSVKHNVLKALVCLTKYMGIYLDFKTKLKQYGIKWTTPSSLETFMRIFKCKHTDLPDWYAKACKVLGEKEGLYLRFMLVSGIRKSEGVNAFNLIVRLSSESRLSEYYNEELRKLEHYKFGQFLRNSKNVYISIIPKDLIAQIASSNYVSYNGIRKHLHKSNMNMRIKELRQYFGTFMVEHGLIREEVDLLQGRIPKSIFVRHYWSPSFTELRDRTLKAIVELEQTLN